VEASRLYGRKVGAAGAVRVARRIPRHSPCGEDRAVFEVALIASLGRHVGTTSLAEFAARIIARF
jgi:hypothetical protein